MFDLLNSQPFILNVNLIQTAFTCNHSISVHRRIGSTLSSLKFSNCRVNSNNGILSISIPLPTQTIDVIVSLVGAKTIGAISLGLNGPSIITDDGR